MTRSTAGERLPSVAHTPLTKAHDHDAGVRGNERLTALAGTVLLALISVEIVTVLTLRTLMTVHIVVGVLLTGPLIVKLASTGYRFIRYYAGSAAYVRRGPPRLPLRLLAPLLVATTILLIGSGIGLVLTGPAAPGPLEALHNLSFVAWLPLVVVHALAYLARALRLVSADAIEHLATPPRGRGWRFIANGGALLLAAGAAIVLLSAADPWVAWSQTQRPIPAFLIVGSVLALLAVLIAELRRWS